MFSKKKKDKPLTSVESLGESFVDASSSSTKKAKPTPLFEDNKGTISPNPSLKSNKTKKKWNLFKSKAITTEESEPESYKSRASSVIEESFQEPLNEPLSVIEMTSQTDAPLVVETHSVVSQAMNNELSSQGESARFTTPSRKSKNSNKQTFPLLLKKETPGSSRLPTPLSLKSPVVTPKVTEISITDSPIIQILPIDYQRRRSMTDPPIQKNHFTVSFFIFFFTFLLL